MERLSSLGCTEPSLFDRIPPATGGRVPWDQACAPVQVRPEPVVANGFSPTTGTPAVTQTAPVGQPCTSCYGEITGPIFLPYSNMNQVVEIYPPSTLPSLPPNFWDSGYVNPPLADGPYGTTQFQNVPQAQPVIDDALSDD